MPRTPRSLPSVRRLIRAIHKASPAAFVVVIALYPDAQQTLLVEETLGKIAAINAAVREGVSTEPNVAFVDFELAPGQDMFQVNLGYEEWCASSGEVLLSVDQGGQTIWPEDWRGGA